MEFAKTIDHIAQSVGFLSRIPVPNRFFENDDGELDETCGYFVFAGLIIAIPIGVIAALLNMIDANSMITAALLLAAGTFITGALHEDGLSDSADGLWGGRDKAKMLDIMKDSRLGTYGTLALVFTILIKFAALSQIIAKLDTFETITAIATIAALSRGTMVWHWNHLPSAKTSGLAADFGTPSNLAMKITLISCAILSFICLLILGTAPTIFAVIGMLVFGFTITRIAETKIEGHTGDTIGATQQLSEMGFLLGLALAI